MSDNPSISSLGSVPPQGGEGSPVSGKSESAGADSRGRIIKHLPDADKAAGEMMGEVKDNAEKQALAKDPTSIGEHDLRRGSVSSGDAIADALAASFFSSSSSSPASSSSSLNAPYSPEDTSKKTKEDAISSLLSPSSSPVSSSLSLSALSSSTSSTPSASVPSQKASPHPLLFVGLDKKGAEVQLKLAVVNEDRSKVDVNRGSQEKHIFWKSADGMHYMSTCHYPASKSPVVPRTITHTQIGKFENAPTKEDLERTIKMYTGLYVSNLVEKKTLLNPPPPAPPKPYPVDNLRDVQGSYHPDSYGRFDDEKGKENATVMLPKEKGSWLLWWNTDNKQFFISQKTESGSIVHTPVNRHGSAGEEKGVEKGSLANLSPALLQKKPAASGAFFLGSFSQTATFEGAILPAAKQTEPAWDVSSFLKGNALNASSSTPQEQESKKSEMSASLSSLLSPRTSSTPPPTTEPETFSSPSSLFASSPSTPTPTTESETFSSPSSLFASNPSTPTPTTESETFSSPSLSPLSLSEPAPSSSNFFSTSSSTTGPVSDFTLSKSFLPSSSAKIKEEPIVPPRTETKFFGTTGKEMFADMKKKTFEQLEQKGEDVLPRLGLFGEAVDKGSTVGGLAKNMEIPGYVPLSNVNASFSDVVLPEKTAVKVNGSYIHANSVTLAGEEGILKQAPTSAAAKELHFQLAAETKGNLIVDLTNSKDVSGTKGMGDIYPKFDPNGRSSVTHGSTVVTCTSEKPVDNCPGTTISTYTVQYKGKDGTLETKEVTRLRYEKWNDMQGADPKDILALNKVIDKHLQGKGGGTPITHCRAGVGRSGAFAVMRAFSKRESRGEFSGKDSKSILETLKNDILQLREQRGLTAVQRPEQMETVLAYANQIINPTPEPSAAQQSAVGEGKTIDISSLLGPKQSAVGEKKATEKGEAVATEKDKAAVEELESRGTELQKSVAKVRGLYDHILGIVKTPQLLTSEYCPGKWFADASDKINEELDGLIMEAKSMSDKEFVDNHTAEKVVVVLGKIADEMENKEMSREEQSDLDASLEPFKKSIASFQASIKDMSNALGKFQEAAKAAPGHIVPGSMTGSITSAAEAKAPAEPRNPLAESITGEMKITAPTTDLDAASKLIKELTEEMKKPYKEWKLIPTSQTTSDASTALETAEAAGKSGSWLVRYSVGKRKVVLERKLNDVIVSTAMKDSEALEKHIRDNKLDPGLFLNKRR